MQSARVRRPLRMRELYLSKLHSEFLGRTDLSLGRW